MPAFYAVPCLPTLEGFFPIPLFPTVFLSYPKSLCMNLRDLCVIRVHCGLEMCDGRQACFQSPLCRRADGRSGSQAVAAAPLQKMVSAGNGYRRRTTACGLVSRTWAPRTGSESLKSTLTSAGRTCSACTAGRRYIVCAFMHHQCSWAFLCCGLALLSSLRVFCLVGSVTLRFTVPYVAISRFAQVFILISRDPAFLDRL